MTYKHNMTTKFADKFDAKKDLKWRPWVGKAYAETGVFIVGMSTDDRDKEWLEVANSARETGEMCFDFDKYDYNDQSYRSFNPMAKMFLCAGAGKEHNRQTVEMFWSSVAFMNFYQKNHQSIKQARP